MRLILLGPPGAGKGTQAKLLSQEFNIPHISTGDILRDEVRDNSELGKTVQKFVNSGELVPDQIMIEVVINRLTKPDAKNGFILDGFPRTCNQADKLNQALGSLRSAIDLVIYFETSAEISIKRLSGRRVCKHCRANFHLQNMPPKKNGFCDFCQRQLYLREDDKAETVKKRLVIYQNQTANLISYYKNNKKLRKVSGDLAAEEVNAQLSDLFNREQLIGHARS